MRLSFFLTLFLLFPPGIFSQTSGGNESVFRGLEEKLLLINKIPIGADYVDVKQIIPEISGLKQEGSLFYAESAVSIFNQEGSIRFNFQYQDTVDLLYNFAYSIDSLDKNTADSLYRVLKLFYSKYYGKGSEHREDYPAGFYNITTVWKKRQFDLILVKNVYSGDNILSWGFQEPHNYKKLSNDAPDFYDIVIPRLQVTPKFLYSNLYYEGNNLIMRKVKGPLSYSSAGNLISENWRKLVRQTKATFVLRDALFSQQDHPYKFIPRALMLPANWITAAVLQKDSIKPVLAPPLYNEEAWSKIKTPEQMFGSFPPSETLFKIAVRMPDKLSDTIYTYNARGTIKTLAEYALKLAEKRDKGVNEMIEEGAELIEASDNLYFGKDTRSEHIIPIMVENPTQHEILEGKGIELNLNDTLHKNTVSAIRRILYRKRLSDGDIAIERYDLSNPRERKRAINVLEELIPKGSSGAIVWLWVTGRLLKNKTLQGEDASAYIGQFQSEIRNSNINESRLRFVNKPSFQLKKKNPKQSLRESVERFRQLELYESVNLNSEQLRVIIDSD